MKNNDNKHFLQENISANPSTSSVESKARSSPPKFTFKPVISEHMPRSQLLHPSSALANADPVLSSLLCFSPWSWAKLRRLLPSPSQPPQSNVCTSRLCPVLGFHRVGLYLHDNKRRTRPEIWFGDSNPPPIVWYAGDLMAKRKANSKDEEMIAEFVRLHYHVLGQVS